jgi:hypothetical protein
VDRTDATGLETETIYISQGPIRTGEIPSSQREVFDTLQTLGGKGSLEDIVTQMKKVGKEGHRVKVRDSLIRLKAKNYVKEDDGRWVIIAKFE